MLAFERGFLTAAEKQVDVLIVEDEPTARRALRTLVASRGYETDAVSSAEDALLHVAGGKYPRVALIDLHLPGMDGIELIRRLHKLDPAIFPILITAAARELVEEMPHSTSLVYFQKPLDFDRLMTILHSHPPNDD